MVPGAALLTLSRTLGCSGAIPIQISGESYDALVQSCVLLLRLLTPTYTHPPTKTLALSFAASRPIRYVLGIACTVADTSLFYAWIL